MRNPRSSERPPGPEHAASQDENRSPAREMVKREGVAIVNKLQEFDPALQEDIVLELILGKVVDFDETFFKKIESLNIDMVKVASALIDGENLSALDLFMDIFDDAFGSIPKESAVALVERGSGAWVIENLYLFETLDRETVSKATAAANKKREGSAS